MTNIDLTTAEREVRDRARAFVEREIIPVRAHLDETAAFPWDIVRNAHATGLLTAHVPRAFGGEGLGLVAMCLIAEEFGYGCLGIGTSLLVNYLGTSTILLFGSPAQQERYLTEFCQKPTLFSFACTETDAGSDLAGIKTEFERHDQAYVLNGAKRFITNASHADYFTVFAKRHGTPRGLSSLTSFVVARETDGVTTGTPVRKLGLHASNTAPLDLKAVAIPTDSRLGREGQGLEVAVKSLLRSRLCIAAAGVGLARAALDHALGYVRQRRQFDRPISDFQVVQCEIAELWEHIEADLALVQVAARGYDAGKDVARYVYAAKDHASKMAIDVTGRCLALLGAYGYTTEQPLEKMVRDARFLEIGEGSSTMQRLMLFQSLLREGIDPP